jgi:hypothetical protein
VFVAIEELLMVASRVAFESGHSVDSLSESEDFKKLGKQIGQERHAINSGVPKA